MTSTINWTPHTLHPAPNDALDVRRIRIADIVQTRNPRADVGDVRELAESIRVKGLLQPIVVRPISYTATYELVCGGRRVAAHQFLGLEEIDASVRQMSEEEADDLRIVENIEREDMEPLDEAEALRDLMVRRGFQIDELAARIGRPPAYVRARLALAELDPKVREAVQAKKLQVAGAQVIASLHSHEDQRRTLDVVLKTQEEDGDCAVSEIRWIIRDEVLRRLDDAPFDTASTELVAEAGACSSCPKQTGAQKTLFPGDKWDKEERCLDSGCYRKKVDAFYALRSAEVKAAGGKVISAADAKKHADSTRFYASTVADLARKDGFGGKSIAEKLSKKQREQLAAHIELGKTKEGQIVEVVPRKVLDEVLKTDKRTASAAQSPTRLPLSDREKKARRAAKMKALVLKRTCEIAALAGEAHDEGLVEGPVFWRALASYMVWRLHHDEQKTLLQRRQEVPKGSSVTELLVKLVLSLDSGGCRGVVFEAMAMEGERDNVYGGVWNSVQKAWKAFAEELGIDRKAVAANVAEEMKASEAKKKPKASKKKVAKKGEAKAAKKAPAKKSKKTDAAIIGAKRKAPAKKAKPQKGGAK